jgi:hypothetical protein
MRSRLFKTAVVVALVLVALRAALPWALEAGINMYLGRNEAFGGRVGDVDIHFLRGAYQLEDLKLARRAPADSPAFLTIRQLDVSLDWKELLRGRFQAEGRVSQPVFDAAVLPRRKPKEEMEEATEAAFPLKVSELKVTDGIVRFPPRSGSSAGVLELRDLAITAKNLRFTEDPSNKTETTVNLTARAPGDGQLALNVRYDPFSDPVKFDLDAGLERVDLKQLNPLLRMAADIDVESGTGSVYAEARAADGAFQGYVKPILKDLNVLDGAKEKSSSLGQKVKEGLADVVGSIFKNDEQKSVGARVPFEGRFDNPKIGLWTAVGTVLRHAFVRALTPGVEDRL